jgi:hypothetical protein
MSTAPAARMPRQIPYILGNEACERFSFYGMRNILVPFLATSMLLYLPEGDRPGAAKDIFHIFVIGVYFFPLLGGWLADRVFGKYRTVLWFSLIYCAGNAMLALFPHHEYGFYSRPVPDRAGLGRNQAAGGLVHGRPVRQVEQAPRQDRVRRLLLDHQLRLAVRLPADAVLLARARPGGGLRHSRRADVSRHRGVLDGARESTCTWRRYRPIRTPS